MSLACAHCNKTGTCKNGKDNASCIRCTTKAEHPWNPFAKASPNVTITGAPCSVCKGRGFLRNLTVTLRRRIAPVLALAIIVMVLCIIWAVTQKSDTHHGEVLALVGTLAGSVTGYYFGGRDGAKTKNSAAVKLKKKTTAPPLAGQPPVV